MKPIMAAIDFSDVTGAVVDSAIRFAGVFDADLILLHVADPDPDFVGYGTGPQSVRDQRAHCYHDEHRRLQEIEKTVRAREVACSSLLIQGPVAEKILEQAAQHEADLLVMGSHGHGSLHRLIAGSSTQGVLRKASCPVLVVPSLAQTGPPPGE